MPDFEALVRRQLGSLGLPPDCEREVIAELATHLEDHHDRLIEQGSGASVAMAEALQSLSHAGVLRSAIVREKEEEMIARHKIIGPGIVALLLSGSVQGLIYMATAHGVAGRWFSVWWVYEVALTMEFPWIFSLLFIGAIAAWTGRRVGAKPSQRLLAAIFPALMLGGLFFVGGSVSLLRDWSSVPHSLMLKSLAIYTIGWVLLPAVAGMMGALPFLRGEQHRQPSSAGATTATA